MASTLANKVIIITGGSRQELAREHPSHLTVLALDTGDAASVAQFGQQVRALPVEHVDVLINNAGVYGRRAHSILDVNPEDFLAPFETNAVGPFLCTQALLREGLLGQAPSAAGVAGGAAAAGPAGPAAAGSPARPRRSSLVLNISSVMASHGDQLVSSRTGGGYAYRASKAALNIMSKAMAMDLEPWGVEVLCMHPGYCRTDMTGGEGWVDVEESAAGILKVLEDEQRPLHGRFIGYNGAEIPW